MQSLEQASVFQQLQLGVETTPGTLVAANKRLLGISVGALKPDIPSESFRPYGSKASTDVLTGKGHGTAPIEGIIAINDLIYMCESAICKGVVTTPGGATDTREWTYLSNNFGPDNIQTYSSDFGSFAGGERSAFGVINGLGFGFDINQPKPTVEGTFLTQIPSGGIWPTGHEVWRLSTTGTVSGGTFTLDVDGQVTGNIAFDATAAVVQAALEALSSVGAGNVFVTGTLAGDDMDVVFGGALFGTNVDDIVVDNTLITGGGTVTATKVQEGSAVTDVPLIPLSSKMFDIYVATTLAGLPADFTSGSDDSQLLRASKFSFKLPDRYGAGKYARTDQESYGAIIEKSIEGAMVEFTHMANQAGREFLAHFKNGQELYVMVVGTSPMEIESGFNYAMQYKGAVKIKAYDPADDDGAYNAGISSEVLYRADIGSYAELKFRTDMQTL